MGAENDKIAHEHVTALSAAAVDALREARKRHDGIGDVYVFRSPKEAGEPVSAHLARDWWERGEVAAGWTHEPGRGWHSLRRKWATEMKHTPIKDLMALGGWKDPTTLTKIYQQPDTVTMR